MTKEKMRPFTRNNEQTPISIVRDLGCLDGKKLVPKKLLRVLRKNTTNPILRVPRRKRGMTSSGKVLFCHKNVERLVQIIGGNQVVGYELQIGVGPTRKYKRYLSRLVLHSVWESPEGKLFDVSKREHDPDFGRNENEILFVPMDWNWENRSDENFPLDNVMWIGKENQFEFQFEHIRQTFNGKNLFKSKMTQFVPNWTTVKGTLDKQSLFSEPSLRSGKTDLDYLKGTSLVA